MSYREPNTEIRMKRITITIEDEFLAEIDAAAEARGYQNRSEILRDLLALIGLVAAGDRVLDAMRHVIPQHFLLHAAQRGPHRRDLRDYVDAVAILLDHF